MYTIPQGTCLIASLLGTDAFGDANTALPDWTGSVWLCGAVSALFLQPTEGEE